MYLNKDGMKTKENIIELNGIGWSWIFLLIECKHSGWPEKETIVKGKTNESSQIITKIIKVESNNRFSSKIHNNLENWWIFKFLSLTA